MSKENDPLYILNPKTNHYVLKSGKAGKAILAEHDKKKQENPSPVKQTICSTDVYLGPRQARTMAGVTTGTLRRWHREGKIRIVRRASGQRTYNQSDLLNILGSDNSSPQKTKVCYARVSSKHQMGDLDRQLEFLRHYYPEHEFLSDVGSGINWNRKGFVSLLERILQGTVSEVVVTEIDRLARFSTDLLRQLFRLCGCKIVVHNQDNKTILGTEGQLVKDVLHILHVYTCRINGKRRRTIKENPNSQAIDQ